MRNVARVLFGSRIRTVASNNLPYTLAVCSHGIAVAPWRSCRPRWCTCSMPSPARPMHYVG